MARLALVDPQAGAPRFGCRVEPHNLGRRGIRQYDEGAAFCCRNQRSLQASLIVFGEPPGGVLREGGRAAQRRIWRIAIYKVTLARLGERAIE
jgi:hypothetical protein